MILHKKNWYYHVSYGKVKFRLFDGRKKSKRNNKKDNISMSTKNHSVLVIPPGVWFSFATDSKKAVIHKLHDRVQSDKEVQKQKRNKNYLIKKINNVKKKSSGYF